MIDSASDRGLIIFIKDPDSGRAKTRIADVVGDARASSIYRELLNITRLTAESCRCRRFLFYADSIRPDDEWTDTLFEKHVQLGHSLGDRMLYAFHTVLATASKAVVIGSDCPYIQTELVEKAFDLLDETDAVIGPTYDGGYYLLGMKTVHPALFRDIPWSTDDVYQLTRAAMRTNGLTYSELPMLSDVDYIEDWEAYQKTLD